MNLTRKSTRSFLCLLFLVAATIFSSGCKGGRFGNMISKQQEVDLGREASVEVEQRFRIVRDTPESERLQRVADRIIPLARADWDVPYSAELIENKEVNAFALPGGPVFFFSGLVKTADSDDEVASVFGHEVAHIVKRHSAKQISDANAKGLLLSILTAGSSDLIQTLANVGLTLDQLRYSRGDEAQSDEVGFRYLTEAGYSPEAMATFFRKLDREDRKKKGMREPEWLRSHPVTSTRVERAEERARAYRKSHGLPPAETVTSSGESIP